MKVTAEVLREITSKFDYMEGRADSSSRLLIRKMELDLLLMKAAGNGHTSLFINGELNDDSTLERLKRDYPDLKIEKTKSGAVGVNIDWSKK